MVLLTYTSRNYFEVTKPLTTIPEIYSVTYVSCMATHDSIRINISATSITQEIPAQKKHKILKPWLV
jgi:hypothetical protein